MLGTPHRSSGVHRAAPNWCVSVERSHAVSLATCLCVPVQRCMENKASNADSSDAEMRQRISRPINIALSLVIWTNFWQLHQG